MVDVLDHFGLPVTLGAVGVLEGSQCAPGDALGRPHHPLESVFYIFKSYMIILNILHVIRPRRGPEIITDTCDNLKYPKGPLDVL